MFIYIHCPREGYMFAEGFYKPEKVATFTIDMISSYLEGYNHPPAKKTKKTMAVGRVVPNPPPNQFLVADLFANPAIPAQDQAMVDPIDPDPAYPPPPQPAAPRRFYDAMIEPLRVESSDIYGVYEDFTIGGNTPTTPDELLDTLRKHLIVSKKPKSIDDAHTAIRLYEAYINHTQGHYSTIHCIQEVKAAHE